MLKKMYTSKNQFKTLVKNPKRRILVLSKDKLSTKEKEIIITDEDLFKNVREVLKERKPCLLDNELERLRILNDLRYKIMKAIQKDIANFDKGVK